MNKLLVIAVLLLAQRVAAPAFSQTLEAAAGFPDGQPIAARAPDYSAWVVSCKYTGVPSEAEQNAKYQAALDRTVKENPGMGKVLAANPAISKRKSRLKEISETRTGKIKRELTTYTSGLVDARWVTQEGIVSQNAITGKYALEVLGENDEPDFLELSWVSKNNFVGTQIIDNKSCLVYKSVVERLRMDDPLMFQQLGSQIPSEKVTAVAIVDLETRLPVRLQYAEQTREYNFQAPPGVSLTLPPEFAAVIRSGQNQLRGSAVGFARP